jgi:hypothetical protein
VGRISIAWFAPLAMLAMFASPAQAAKKGPDLKVAKLRLLGSPAPGQSFTVQVKAGASQTALVLSRDARVSKGDVVAATGPRAGAISVSWAGRTRTVSLRSAKPRRRTIRVLRLGRTRKGTVVVRTRSARRVAIASLVVSR